MPAIDQVDLDRIRWGPPRTEWFLAIAPTGDPLYSARATACARGDMWIPYDGGGGVIGDVQPGMTLWVGTYSGTFDLGTIRIRNVTGTGAAIGTFGVAENDHIEWANDVWLTVPCESGFRQPWSVYPRIVDGDPVTFYKDYDVAYTNEGDHLSPKANGGPAAIGWIAAGTGTTASLDFVGEFSFATEVLGVPIANQHWTFPDGNPATSGVLGTVAAPVVVSWATAGFRYVELRVIDSLGTTGTTHIPVWIFDEDDPSRPYDRVQVISQQGTLDGWTLRVKVFEAEAADFPDNALVALGVQTWYEGSQAEVGGFHDRSNVRFAGWLQQETLNFDATAGWVEFDVKTTDAVMRRMPGFGQFLSDTAGPTNWTEMEDLCVDRAFHHMLEFHSTINQISHVEQLGEMATRSIYEAGFPDVPIYSQVQDNLVGDCQARLIGDKQNMLRVRFDPQMLDAADRNADVDVAATLTEQDWVNRVSEMKPHAPTLGMVWIGGFDYQTVLLSQAPGDAPRQSDAEVQVGDKILVNQAEANLWSGLTLTKANNPYPAVPLTLKGFWPLDPAYREYVRLTFTDPLARNPLSNQRFIVNEVDYRDDSAHAMVGTTELLLEMESTVQSGETEVVPTAPPPEYPPWDPPIGPLPPPIEPPAIEDLPVKACVNIIGTQMGYTDDLLEHHVNSVCEAGSGAALIIDSTVDFVTLGIAVGDVAENLTTMAITTVASVDSLHQLTLTAGIALGVGVPYHIAGVQWSDSKGAVIGAGETFIQFKYVQTGPSTVGAWCLTDNAAYWTANILTATPTWSQKLTIAQIRTFTGYNDPKCAMRGLAVWAANSAYAIISFTMRDSGAANTYGCAHTSNTGGAWLYSTFPATLQNNKCPYHAIEIDQVSGAIYHIRGTNAVSMWVWESVDNGSNFARGTSVVADWAHHDTVGGLHRPYSMAGTTVLFCDVRQSSTTPGYSGDNGDHWGVLLAAGYTKIDLGMSDVVGWYGDQHDVLSTDFTEDPAPGHRVLLRSRDDGGTWAEIGDQEVLFSGEPVGWGAEPYACVPEMWAADEDVMIWGAFIQSGFGGSHDQRRLFYTDDDGATWMSKMGNWYAVFTTWANGDPEGTGVCTPLPRVGSNL